MGKLCWGAGGGAADVVVGASKAVGQLKDIHWGRFLGIITGGNGMPP
jgi:hypothetical protein